MILCVLAVGPFMTLIKVFIVLSSLLGTIVILNLLIARMSDSYERIQDEAEMERRRLQARIIQKYEVLLWKRGGNPWLHVLLPVGRNTPKVAKTEWAGVLNDVKDKLGSRIQGVESKLEKQLKGELRTDLEKQSKQLVEQNKELRTEQEKQNEMLRAELEKQSKEMEKQSKALADILAAVK